ncbi:MAG: TonB-dependent receptor [Pseudohongiella sp.]|nr:TonB-dependent receptor [Pseudohongiella sp.]
MKFSTRTSLAFAIAASCLALTSTGLHAQTGTAAATMQLAQAQQAGSVQGRVVDSDTGLPLGGAIVRIPDAGLEVSTTPEGLFLIPVVPAGNHRVVVSFIGYPTQSDSVTVAAGDRVRADVAMSAGTYLDGMTVTGYRGAQSRALSQQRASDNIVNIISADTLGDFPDVSVAESVGRIPGVAVTRFRGEAETAVIRGGNPAWTRVAVDGLNIPSAGGSRSVQLGQLSSEVVSAIEITKAPTPDMDADAIGGTINIRSRGALTSSARVAGNASMGKSELGQRNNSEAALSFAQVFDRESGSHGVLASISQNRVDREMNNKESSFVQVNGEWMPDRLQTKAYDIKRDRSALELRYDFMNATEDNHFFVSFARTNYVADEDRHTVIIRNRDANTYRAGSDNLAGVWNRTRMEQNWTDRHTDNTQDILTIGGKREFNGVVWDYNAAYSTAENLTKPGRTGWTWRWDSTRPMAYDYNDPDFPVLTFADTGEIPTVGGNINPNVFSFRHGSNNLNNALAEETAYQAQTKVEIPMSLAGNAGYWRFGAKYTERDRVNDSEQFIITAGGPALASLLTDKPINNFGKFPFGYRFNKDATNTVKSGMTTTRNLASAFGNDFEINEKVYAGFAMGVIDINLWRLIAGVRVENTHTDSQGFRSDDNWATIPIATQFSRSYTDYFPSLHAKYDVTENMVFRAAYSSGISRPSFSDMRPTVAVNEDSQSISASNLALAPSKSQAVDVMLEYYIQPIGVVSAGIFVKEVDDVHFGFSRNIVPGESFNGYVVGNDGWRLTETTNSGKSAQISGFELAWDQALTFLPGVLDGLGVFANYTYTKSEAYLPGTNQKTPLGAQPEDTVNLALYYEKFGFSTRLAYNFQSKRISNFGDGTPASFNWWDSRGIVDLTARYAINDNFTVYLEANNLTDTLGRRYIGSTQRVDELEDFGRAYSAGLRFNF